MSSEFDKLCISTMKDLEESISKMKKMILLPFPIYENMNKAAAYINYCLKKYELAAFYLSESHGGGIRSKLSLSIHPNTNIDTDLNDCLSLNSKYVNDGYNGLLNRLKEMPPEWTLIQITRSYESKEIVTPRPAEMSMEMTDLFITRYQCGQLCNKIIPFTVKINKPTTSLGQKSIFEVLKKSLDDTNDKKVKDHSKIRNLREAASISIQSISQEIHSSWLKHWICLLMGNYIDVKLANEVLEVIDNVIKSENIVISDRSRMILYQITNAAVMLSDIEIKNALQEVECKEGDKIKLEFAINTYRLNGSYLVTKKRYAVMLILDEHLECLPWETIPYLKRHPVSRVPSVHVVHRLFVKHKSSICNGLMEINTNGYYMINTDKTLSNAEKRMLSFLKERDINWQGLHSEEPTSEKFTEILRKNNIILYCGHGNGTQYLHSLELDKLDLQSVPMLFGCSSAKHSDKGGRTNFVGASYGYLKAG
ncbi:uncharacterized protein LOC126905523 isoform X2 [Daktulosphaira vitifoliae]|nr:uncharacterized protein LOC126905523 isoform X2 [Daktulosphaira vitifoliae]